MPDKNTSPRVASLSSKILRDGRFSKNPNPQLQAHYLKLFCFKEYRNRLLSTLGNI
jgi:hypothetical protein